MHSRAFTLMLRLMVILFLTVSLIACEGAGKRDREVRDKMTEKINQWNKEGFPIPNEQFIPQTIENVKSFRFKYAKLFLVFDTSKSHPLEKRGIVEAVALAWWQTYPDNMKPRFTLEVRGFDDADSGENEVGRTYVNRNGELETHWYATDIR